MAEWFVRWTTKLATRVRSKVTAGYRLDIKCCVVHVTQPGTVTSSIGLNNRGGNWHASCALLETKCSIHTTFIDYPH